MPHNHHPPSARGESLQLARTYKIGDVVNPVYKKIGKNKEGIIYFTTSSQWLSLKKSKTSKERKSMVHTKQNNESVN